MINNKLICLVGLAGAGKSEVSEYLMKKDSFGYVRFGQIVLDKVKEAGLEPSEENEKVFRLSLREEHGMAVMAILNFDKISKLLKEGDVIGDGLRSFEEYLFLKEKFGRDLVVISVYAPPKMRYDRLSNRAERHGEDVKKKYRSFTKEESWARDKSEIEDAHIGGTVAMADFIIQNIGTVEELHAQIDKVLAEIKTN